MRYINAFLLASAAVFGTASYAADVVKVEKVKTGILPDGGFYRLYEVACRDDFTATIATVGGARGWCSLQNGSVSCGSSKQDASLSACMAGAVAAAEEDLVAVNKYQ